MKQTNTFIKLWVIKNQTKFVAKCACFVSGRLPVKGMLARIILSNALVCMSRAKMNLSKRGIKHHMLWVWITHTNAKIFALTTQAKLLENILHINWNYYYIHLVPQTFHIQGLANGWYLRGRLKNVFHKFIGGLILQCIILRNTFVLFVIFP